MLQWPKPFIPKSALFRFLYNNLMLCRLFLEPFFESSSFSWSIPKSCSADFWGSLSNIKYLIVAVFVNYCNLSKIGLNLKMHYFTSETWSIKHLSTDCIWLEPKIDPVQTGGFPTVLWERKHVLLNNLVNEQGLFWLLSKIEPLILHARPLH